MKLVGKTEFARTAGVTPGAITKAIKQDRLKVKDGKIDLDDPVTLEYLQKRAEARQAQMPPPRSRMRSPADEVPGEEDEPEAKKMGRREFEIEKVKHQALYLRLRNANLIGTMVRREDVIRSVMNPVSTAFLRLLTDVSKTIAAQVKPMVQGGASTEEIETYIRGQHSTCVKNLKLQMKKALRSPS